MKKREKILKQASEIAKESFRNHEIVKTGEDRWIIAEKKNGYVSSTYKTEIIALYNNSIYVGGDIDVVVFSYGPPDVIERLKWIGQNNSYRYIEEKARIGTSVHFCEIDNDVLKEDLIDLAADFPDNSEEIMGLVDMVPDIDYIREKMHGIFQEDMGVGKVIDSRIIFAKEALSRLCYLLDI
jgi:hypothetical protein